MTKKEFFRYCDGADKKYGLYVSWGIIPRELERAVFLNGSFFRNSTSTIQLYKPTPGRQHSDVYQSANKACEKACAKFEAWLKEWREK